MPRHQKGKNKHENVKMEYALPDRVFSVIAVNPAVLMKDDVSFQVSIIVVSRVVVGDNSGWDAQTTQD